MVGFYFDLVTTASFQILPNSSIMIWPRHKMDHASCFKRLTECSFHSPREQHSLQSKYFLMPWHEKTITHPTNTKHGYKHDGLEENVLPELTGAGPTLRTSRRVSDSASMCRPTGRPRTAATATTRRLVQHHLAVHGWTTLYLLASGDFKFTCNSHVFEKSKRYRITLFGRGIKLDSLHITKYLYNIIMFPKFPHCLPPLFFNSQAGSTRHVGHWMAYCICPGWIWWWRIWWNEDWQGKTQRTRRTTTPAPLCPPQIPLDQTRARTRAAAVGSQRLIAWAMARPSFPLGLAYVF
jgi:hypothetical protein